MTTIVKRATAVGLPLIMAILFPLQALAATIQTVEVTDLATNGAFADVNYQIQCLPSPSPSSYSPVTVSIRIVQVRSDGQVVQGFVFQQLGTLNCDSSTHFFTANDIFGSNPEGLTWEAGGPDAQWVLSLYLPGMALQYQGDASVD